MSTANTNHDVGIRINFPTLGDRNFEDDQATPVQYKSNFAGLEFMSTGSTVSRYAVGDNLPFDVGGVSYSKAALAVLQLYWNFGFIQPAT